MKKILTYLLLLCCVASFAQDTRDAFSNRINHIFQHVDKSQINTGILQEYGIEFTNLNNYNGQILNDSNKVVLSEWRNLYASLYTS